MPDEQAVTSRPAGHADADARAGSSDGSGQPIAAAARPASGHARSARESVFDVNPSRFDSRLTCVSTTIPLAIPNAVPSTTFAVLRPTPARAVNASSVAGDLAVVPLTTWPAIASRLRALARKKPVDRISNLRAHPGAAFARLAGSG